MVCGVWPYCVSSLRCLMLVAFVALVVTSFDIWVVSGLCFDCVYGSMRILRSRLMMFIAYCVLIVFGFVFCYRLVCCWF